MGTVNKARLAARQVYILHGWTYSTDKWQPFIDLLKQKGFDVNILKIPGLTAPLSGAKVKLSLTEKLDKVWGIDDYVEWLKNKMDSNETMKQSNNRAILISHSNGGRIALNFAIKFPDKLSHLILIDSAGVYHNKLSVKIKRLVFGSIAKVGKKLTSSEKFRSLLYKIVGENDYKKATPVMKQTMVNLINSDKSLNLNEITTPTLIIWGREDKTTPLSDGILMNKLIKNSKLYVVDSAKHSPQFTHTEIVINRIYEELVSRRSGER